MESRGILDQPRTVAAADVQGQLSTQCSQLVQRNNRLHFLKEYLPTEQLGSITTNRSFNRLLSYSRKPDLYGSDPNKTTKTVRNGAHKGAAEIFVCFPRSQKASSSQLHRGIDETDTPVY